jgi:hypothetical protein
MNITYEEILEFLEIQKASIQLEQEKAELLLKTSDPLSIMDKIDLLSKLAYIRGKSECSQELIIYIDKIIDA